MASALLTDDEFMGPAPSGVGPQSPMAPQPKALLSDDEFLAAPKPAPAPAAPESFDEGPTTMDRLANAPAAFGQGVITAATGLPKMGSILSAELAQQRLQNINEPYVPPAGDSAAEVAAARVRQSNIHPAPDVVAERRAFLEEQAAQPVQDRPLYAAAHAVEEFGKNLMPTDPRLRDEWLAQKIPGGLGSVAGFMLAGGAARLAGLTPGPAMAITGAGSQGAEQFEDAIKHGASLPDAFKAANLGAFVGTSEALPLSLLLDRLDKGTGGSIKRLLAQAAIQGTEEAAQEAFQNVAGNLIANKIVAYDPSRETFEGTGEAAGLGFTVGALAQMIGHLVLGRRARHGQQPSQPPAEPPPGAPQGAVPADQVIPAPAPENAAETTIPPDGAAPIAQPEQAVTPAAETPPGITPAANNPDGNFRSDPAARDTNADILSENVPPAATEMVQPEPPGEPHGAGVLKQMLDDPRSVDEIKADVAASQAINPDAVMALPDTALTGRIIKAFEGQFEDGQRVPGMAVQLPRAISDAMEQAGLFDPKSGLLTYAGLRAIKDEAARRAAIPATPGTKEAPVELEQPTDVHVGAEQTEQPTPAQAEAGNYQKRHLKWKGLDIAIETEAGGERTGVAPDGTPWSHTTSHPYGYIKRTTGKDGDQIDVYIGPHPQSPKVFVFDQIDPDNRKFDEHKAVIGARDENEAIAIYDAGFSDGSAMHRRGAFTEMTVAQFKQWVKNGNTKKALAYKPQPAPRKKAKQEAMSLFEFLSDRGGIKDQSGELRHLGLDKHFIPGYGRLVRSTGMSLDEAREAAVEAGYLYDAGYGQQNVEATSTTRDLLDALNREARGQKVYSRHDEEAAYLREQKRQNRADEERLEDTIAEAREIVAEMGIGGLTDADIRHAAETSLRDGIDVIDALVAISEREADNTAGEAVSYEDTEIPYGEDATGADRDGAGLPAPGEYAEGPAGQLAQETAPAGREPARPEPARSESGQDRGAAEGESRGEVAAPKSGPGPRKRDFPSYTTQQLRDTLADSARVRGMTPAMVERMRAEVRAREDGTSVERVTPQIGGAGAWQPIGKNADGDTLYEDQRGVRSIIKKGVRSSEPVHIAPRRQGVSIEKPVHKDKWRLVSELGDDATDQQWWDEGLTTAGRADILNGLGIKLPPRVSWQHISPENQEKLLTRRPQKGASQQPSGPVRAEEQTATPKGPVLGQEQTDASGSVRSDEAGPMSNLPALDLANDLLARLNTGKPITAKILQSMATEIYGAKLADGKFDRKDIQDALELAVNLYVKDTRHLRVDSPNAAQAIKMLGDVLAELPTQRVRSEEQESFQQFSTPPNYAAAAVYAANVKPGDVMLEPSAGTGSIVAAASAPGVTIVANELSPRRTALLRRLIGRDGRVFTENAEQIDNILPDDVKPSVVVMNPPFSQTAGRLGNQKSPMVAAEHIEAALNLLQPGGRLVAIVGRGMTMGAPTYRAWWSKIGKKYAVRANIGVDGKVYEKYGTTFGTRVLVIDKVAPTQNQPILKDVQSVDDLLRTLEPIRDDRPDIQQSSTEPPRAAKAEASEGGRAAASPASAESGDVGDRERGQGGVAPERSGGSGTAGNGPVRVEAGERDGVALEQSKRPGESRAAGRSEAGAGTSQPEKGGGTGAKSDLQSSTSGQSSAAASSERVELEQARPGTQAAAELNESLYQQYEPQRVRVKGAKPHPGPLVESASMSSVPPPAATYQPSFPKKVIEGGLLSLPQLEAIVYAGQAHQKMLPAAENETPKRRGYFIGDGTGVGKGREIAGTILDNFQQGRTKAIWVSEKQTLIQDAKRDWGGLGQDANQIFNAGKVKSGEPIQPKKGIAFITYDTLKGGMSDQEAIARGQFVRKQKVSVNGQSGTVQRVEPGKRGQPGNVVVNLDNGSQVTVSAAEVAALEKATAKSRVDQLVDWVGADFDGVIAFDEAHNMGNASATKGERGPKDAAQKALAGIALQDRLPNARVVYVSATGATEVSNLAYASRLGLWGRGTPFASQAKFVAEIESGGIAAMELVARDMKQLGLYTARNLSYDGVEYERVEHVLDPNQREIYDTLAEAWQNVLRNINAALEETGGNKDSRAKSAAMSAFWGGHQRFFNQIVTSMQMPSVIKAVEKDLAAGHQVVLQLTNTNEASQERAAAKATTAEEIEDLDITPRDQIIQLVEKSFPTQEYEQYVDSDGKKRSRPVVDSHGNPVQNKQAVAMREALIDRLASIRVPQGPLDLVLDHFGHENVAEVTGRGRRFILKTDEKTGQRRRMEDARGTSANLAETDSFQEGKKKILVFSEAGGTGRSYHADNTAKSKGSRRVHYLVQGGWRADKAVQGFGRTHRTNQASAPIFRLVTTDLKGQKRFISSIARRLAQLGALTKGQRQAGDQGVFSARDNLESTEAHQALRHFYDAILRDRIEGVTLKEFEEQTGLQLQTKDEEGRVTGTKQDLPPITQFLNRMLSLKIDMQNRVFDAFSDFLDAVIEARAQAGLLDVGLETVKADKIEKVDEKIVHTVEETGAHTTYVKFKLADKFKPLDFQDVADSKSRKILFWVTSPRDRVYAVAEAPSLTEDSGKIIDNYRIINPVSGGHLTDRATINNGRGWHKIDRDRAEALWKAEIDDAPEYVTRDMHMISGAILPIWDRLGGKARVVRLQTDQGERFIGRVVPSAALSSTLKKLGAEADAPKITPEGLYQGLMAGSRAMLANGWTLKRSRVAGENRIELIGPVTFSEGNEVKADGVFTERIDYKARYFVPASAEEGPKVLARLTKFRTVTEFGDAGANAASPSPGEDSQFSAAPKGWRIAEAGDAQRMSEADAARVEEIVRRVADVDPALVDSIAIPEGSAGARAWGLEKGGKAQGVYMPMLDAIAVAMDVGSPRAAYHEAFHRLQHRFLNKREKAILEAEGKSLRNVLRADAAGRNVDSMSQKEVEAEAFAAYAINRDAGRDTPGLNRNLSRAWGRLLTMLRRLRNVLRGLGYQTAEDIFAGAHSGEIASRGANPVAENGKPLFSNEVDVGADGKPQLVLPGAERISEKERLERLAAQPKRGAKAQKSAEGLPLFGDQRNQADLFDAPKKDQGSLFSLAGPTDSAAFKRWFGNSKVVNKDGSPKVVYHGTDADFTTFERTEDIGFHFGSADTASKRVLSASGYGIARGEGSRNAYKSAVRDGHVAEGGNVMPVYLKIEKPLRTNDLYDWAPTKVLRELHRVGVLSDEQLDDTFTMRRDLVDREFVQKALAAKGYDGIVYRNSVEGKGDSYIVFEPAQIKSATANRGTFDGSDPNAMFSLAQEPETAVDRQNVEQGLLARGQYLDQALRIPFDMFGGLTADGQWKPGAKLYAKAANVITTAKFSPQSRFAFLNPAMEVARAGLVDRYGLDEKYVERDRARTLDERAVMLQGAEVLKTLASHSVGPAEARVLQAILTGENVTDADMQALAEPIRAAIDQLGQEAVALGMVSGESFERNRGTYLHRVYQKYESQQNGLVRFVNGVMGSRRKRIIGDQYKGRGLFQEVAVGRLMRDVPDWHEGAKGKPENGEKFIRLDEMPNQNALTLGGNQSADKPLRTVYWPANKAIPERYENFTNQGVWEVRGSRGNDITIWRDFTKAEREKMGEILDARYTIGKTFMLMAHDLAVGKFYKDIAENEDWASKQPPAGKTIDAAEWQAQWQRAAKRGDIEWVRVPDTNIPNSGGKKRWGALAGMYVREEIWRDLHEQEIMNRPGIWRTLLTQWKLNKTARNPVVHMNNVVSNFLLMDLLDVRMQDLIDGIRSYANGDAHYREAFENGAFGADMISQEIRDQVLRPLLEEIERGGAAPNNPLGLMGTASKFTDMLWSKWKAFDQFAKDAYRVEDEIFRMATYNRRRALGDSPKQAAEHAREQFIDYDIRAPWVNMARNSVLPFISYTYRAVPLLARAVATRPWKIAKYAALAYGLNALAYAISGGDEDRERRSLRESEQGRTWMGAHRMLRLPLNDKYGNPIFLDVRRWMPGGDVFDTNQGQAALPIIPAWLNVAGPLMLAAEFILNRQAFTGREITNDKTDDWWGKASKVSDWAYKSWMPSAAYVPGSWYFQKVYDAATGVRERGTDRPLSLPQALASSVGVKMKPEDVDRNMARKGREFKRVEDALKAEARNLSADNERGALSDAAFNRAMENLLKKLERNAKKAEETLK